MLPLLTGIGRYWSRAGRCARPWPGTARSSWTRAKSCSRRLPTFRAGNS